MHYRGQTIEHRKFPYGWPYINVGARKLRQKSRSQLPNAAFFTNVMCVSLSRLISHSADIG